jgi:UDP-N-acetylmuramoyl-tripeptide--D-alanyl-D-alanine ligase
MIPMPLRDVAVLTDGSLHPVERGGVVVDGPVVTDSREAGPGSLYVARVGEHADGHAYVGPARDRGAVAALTSRVIDELPCVVVDDVQTAFGRLARGVVDRATGLTVVAVTGSSGKTSTKDLLAQVLRAAGETVAPVNSLNGEIGVPLTVCRVTPATRFLVAEMGARGVGHLAYLTTIAPPDVAVVLNVGVAHVGEFGSKGAVAQAKGELVEALRPDGLAVLNADDPEVAKMRSRTQARVVTVGTRADADIRAADVRLDALGHASFVVEVPNGGRAKVELQLSGAHHVGNALAVVATALECGLGLDLVATALSAARAASRWRMEIHERPDGVTVVNDAYNANPESVTAALKTARWMAGDARLIAVLGTMAELGPITDEAHEHVGELAARLRVDRLITVGGAASAIVTAGIREGVEPTQAAAYDDPADALADIREHARPGDVVLFKASRVAGLEALAEALR